MIIGINRESEYSRLFRYRNSIDLMMSHINSYTREKLSDKSPFEMFDFFHGYNVLEKLGQYKIPANEILLRPTLLKRGG